MNDSHLMLKQNLVLMLVLKVTKQKLMMKDNSHVVKTDTMDTLQMMIL